MSATQKRSDRRTVVYILLISVFIILFIFLLAFLLEPTDKQKIAAGVYPSDNSVVFMDVGQGDSALIKSGNEYAVIDTGTPESADELCEKLKSAGVGSINTMLLSHNHDDHIGGSSALAEVFKIKNLLLPDISNTSSPTKIIGSVSKSVELSGGNCVTARSGMFYKIGDAQLAVLCCYYESANENERSIVCIAEMNGKKFLFTGDLGKTGENRIIKDGIDVDCDVLKVGHHGSKGSSTAAFLAEATPDYAVISCGAGNVYHHPNDEALTRLKNSGAVILRTDKNGDITFYFDKNIFTYKTQK